MPLYDNEIRVELTAPADPSADTEITVAAPESKPNNVPPDPGGSTAPLVLMDGWYGYTQSERITYTGRTDNGDGTYTLTGVTWAQEGTSSPTSWPAGTFAVQDIPASWYEDREQADNGPVTASDIDSEETPAAEVIKADGNGAATWGPVGWTEIASKPSTFPPAAHTHEVDALSATGITAGHVPVAQGDDTIVWEAQSGSGGPNPEVDTVTYTEAAAPDTPAAGKLVTYAKTDGKLYIKDDSGTETDLTEGGGGSSTLSINNQTGSEYTLVSGDDDAYIRMSHADKNKIIIPADSSVNFSIGTKIPVRQVSSGPTLVDWESGVSVHAPSKPRGGKGSHSWLVKVAADEWDVWGEILTAGYRNNVVADAPLSYWRLGEASGATAFDEMSRNNGSYVGSPTLGVTGAVSGDDTAITLDGTDDGVEVPYSPDWDVVQFSLEAWVKVVETGKNQQILCRDDTDGGNRAFQFRVNTNGKAHFILFIDSSSIDDVAGGTSIDDGAWHHVVATYDQENLKVYVDGSEDGLEPQTSAPHVTNTPLTIGYKITSGTTGNPDAFFEGSIDEPAFYNFTLTAQQVADHYNAA